MTNNQNERTFEFNRRKFLKTASIAGMGGITIFSGTAAAETLSVPDDHSTIQEAVDAAKDGDTITVKASGGPYNESVTIEGTNNLTLKGINNPTIVGMGSASGSQPHAAIHVDGNGPTKETTIEGFTIRNPDGHYGVYAGTGGSNSDVDGFELRGNVIKDIATNLSNHSALAGGVAGLYVRAQYNSITVENNTVKNVDTSGDQWQNAVGLSFSSFIGDAAFDSSDQTSEAGNNTKISNNRITDITGALSSRTKGISISGEFDDLTIEDNTVTGISAPKNDSDVLAITLTENPSKEGVNPDDDGTNERIGPKNFVIQRNEISDLVGNELSALFIGGYEDLGDNHDVRRNNFLSGAVSRILYDQDGFDHPDADTLSAECNWWGDETGPEREAGNSGKTVGEGQPAVGKIDFTPWLTEEFDEDEQPECNGRPEKGEENEEEEGEEGEGEEGEGENGNNGKKGEKEKDEGDEGEE